MSNYRYSFTINHMRKTCDFKEYDKLFEEGLFQGAEIFYPYQLDKLDFDTYTNNVLSLKNKYNIELVLHLPFGGKDNDLMSKEGLNNLRFFKAMDYASMFGIKKLTLHLGSRLEKSEKENLDIAISNVSIILDYAKKYNQVVMIENMPGLNEIGSTLDEMKYILDSLSMKYDNIKLIYDTGHAHVSMKDTLKEIEFLKALKKYLYHMHINDNDSSRDMHGRIGLGNIEFKKVFEEVKDEFLGLYCLEIIFNDTNDLRAYLKDLKSALE